MPEDAERKGLGTPATRAGVIEKLVRIGFLERQGRGKTKYLIPTHKGTALVTVMPEQIQSPSMTADWEAKLLQIEKNAYEASSFMDEIKGMISSLVQTYQVIEGADIVAKRGYESIGKCPVCGSTVENRNKGYFCSNRDCKFMLWKENRYFASIGQKLTAKVAQELLRTGKVRLIGCNSAKTGRSFDADLVMKTDESGHVSFSLEFTKSTKGGKRK